MNIINKNIEEQVVGFLNAKLLKEKGFGVPCSKAFDFNGQIEEGGFREGNSWQLRTFDYNTTLNYACSAPTQQLVIDWIRINFGIHISVDIAGNNSYYGEQNGKYMYCISEIKKGKSLENSWTYQILFNTPEEVKETAINYVLNNLITL